MFYPPIGDRFNYFIASQNKMPQMTGANGANGQLLQVLDMALVNGSPTQPVASVTIDGNNVTLDYGVAHGYLPKQLLIIAGADSAAINGEHRIQSKTSNTVTLNISGTTVNTGTITTKLAGLGWASLVANTDPLVRAYRSNNPSSNQDILHLNMTLPTNHGYDATNPAKRAMVKVFDRRDSNDAFVDDYFAGINANQVNGSLFWYQKRSDSKAGAVNTTNNISWVIIGNDEYFLLITGWNSNYTSNYRDVFGFGDFISFSDADVGNTFLLAANNANDANSLAVSIGAVQNHTSYTAVITQSADATQGYKKFVLSSNFKADNTAVYSGYQGLPYPNPVGMSLVTMPTAFVQVDNIARGYLPRLHTIANTISDSADLVINGDMLIVGLAAGSYKGAYALYIGD